MASYVDKMLLSGEKVIARGGKHALTYFHGLFFVFLSIFFIGLSMNLEEKYGFSKILFTFRSVDFTVKNAVYALYSLSIMFFVYGIYSFFQVSTWSSYIITNRRFIRKFGLMKRVVTEMSLHDVLRVEVKQGVFGKIFNYGDIYVYDHSYANDRVVMYADGKVVSDKEIPSKDNVVMVMIEDPYAFQRYVTIIVRARNTQKDTPYPKPNTNVKKIT